jgi:hypothetical protein
MNKKHMVLVAIMVFAVTDLSQAQNFFPVLKKYTAADKEWVDKIYAACLRSGHNGIIEDALSIVTMMKLDVPFDEFPNIEDEIKDLVVEGATPVIRYKAYLAGVVYDNPELFKEEATHQYGESKEFFSALSKKMSKAYFSSIK